MRKTDNLKKLDEITKGIIEQVDASKELYVHKPELLGMAVVSLGSIIRALIENARQDAVKQEMDITSKF